MNADFLTEADATLRLVGTAVEEQRMSLPLAALTLTQTYARYGIRLSEHGAAVMVARWCSNRPAVADTDHPLYVQPPQPSQETLQLAMLQATIGLLGDLADRAQAGEAITVEELCRQREAHIGALADLGYGLRDGEVVPA